MQIKINKNIKMKKIKTAVSNEVITGLFNLMMNSNKPGGTFPMAALNLGMSKFKPVVLLLLPWNV